MKVSNNAGLTNLNSLDVSKNDKLDKKSDTFSRSKDLGSSNVDTKSAAKLNLSDRAQQMNKASEIASKVDDVDNEKVARLQKLIDSGKYEVDAKSVADRLIDEHILMS